LSIRRAILRLTAVMICGAASVADAQLRICEWNVTNYSYNLPDGRDAAFRTAIYGQFEGRSLAPDVLVCQEFISQASVTAFLSLLNNAPGSPGDWAAGQFVDGNDTDSALFYRTTRVDLLQVATIAIGGPPPNQPRNTMRYLVRPKNYNANAAILAIYSSHMKAGATSDDQARRALEATRIRANAEALNPAYHFMLCGDLNIQTSQEEAYQVLVASQSNDAGRFFDPISTPGHWNNNCAFRFVHTQDPAGAGGMDDRYDQILVELSLLDGQGLSYIGQPGIPYSTSTWNDANHSYRAWGNDGTSCNSSLRINGNTMVGPVIAQALVTAAASGGHLPVFADFRVPAKLDAPLLIDFGQVALDDLAEQTFIVSNAGDVALWTVAGIDALDYTLSASAGFTAPGGAFVEPAGGGGNLHVVSMDTSTPGPKSGTLSILSDAPENPQWVISLVGEVLGGVIGDIDGDGDVDQSDLGLLLTAWGTCLGDPDYNPAADLDGSGCIGQGDLGLLLSNFGG
jgi:hypothetical protein